MEQIAKDTVVQYYPDERDASKHFMAKVIGYTKTGNVKILVLNSEGSERLCVPPPSRRNEAKRTISYSA